MTTFIKFERILLLLLIVYYYIVINVTINDLFWDNLSEKILLLSENHKYYKE